MTEPRGRGSDPAQAEGRLSQDTAAAPVPHGAEGLGGLFEDLEQQAAGIHLADRDSELADRARGEYAAVTFSSRVHASLGRTVALSLSGGTLVEGTLAQAGTDWCLVAPAGPQPVWLVRTAGVVTAYGMSARAVPQAARPVVARLPFRSALHRLAEESREVLLHLEAGGTQRVRVARLGADFVEAEPTREGAEAASLLLVPFTAILAARPG